MEKPVEREELTWIVVFRLSCVAAIGSCLFLLYSLRQLVVNLSDDGAVTYYK